MKVLKVFDFIIYWAIIIMPFSVAIAPGMANAFIGIFSVFYILKKLIKRESPKINKWVLFSFLCLILASLASFINSVSYGTSFQGIIKLLKYLLILLVCGEEIKDRKHVVKIAISICCGVVFAAVDGLWQFYLGQDFVHGIAVHYNIGLRRASASFPDPNVFGVYMSALIPLVLGLTLLYFKGKQRVFMILPVVLGLLGAFLTFARGTGLAIFVTTLFLCILSRKKWLIIGLVAILVIFPFVMPKNIKQWAKDVNYNPIVFMLNYDRLSIYRNTFNMIKHHPIVGVGVNTYIKNYAKYKFPEKDYEQTGDSIYAHNSFMQLTAELGLLGLASFLWFLFEVFKLGINTYRKLKDDYLKAIVLSVIACMISFLINGLTETSLYYPRVVMVFWYLIGIILSLSRFTDKVCWNKAKT